MPIQCYKGGDSLIIAYFATSIFWFVVNFLAICVCRYQIIENGWAENTEFTRNQAIAIFSVSMLIPVWRVFWLGCVLYASNNRRP